VRYLREVPGIEVPDDVIARIEGVPASRQEDEGVKIATEIQKVRRTGLTFAPEAGSWRLRQVINKLILEDKIFADVGSLGTEHNQAIRPLLNQRKIPQILVSTGASYWGAQHDDFPDTIGWQPSYVTEGRAYGTWIRKNAPNAKTSASAPMAVASREGMPGLYRSAATRMERSGKKSEAWSRPR